MEFKDLVKSRRLEIGATLEEIGQKVGARLLSKDGKAAKSKISDGIK